MSETTRTEIPESLREELLRLADARKAGPCLDFERMEGLAMNPSFWTEAEREHVACCRGCARSTRVAMRELRHPSYWTFLMERLGLAGARERQWVELHRNGGCVVCKKALDRLSSLEGFAIQFPSFRVPAPASAQPGYVKGSAVTGRAAGPALHVSASSHGDPHTGATFSEHESRLFLEVRSRGETQEHRLYRFDVRDSAGETAEEGFVVLHQGLAGDALVSARLADDLYNRLPRDREPRPVVAPVDLDLLDPEERERLPAAAAAAVAEQIEGDTDAPFRREAWRAWAQAEKEQPVRTEEEQELLERVLAVLEDKATGKESKG